MQAIRTARQRTIGRFACKQASATERNRGGQHDVGLVSSNASGQPRGSSFFSRGTGRRELARDFVHIAPRPLLSGHHRTHHGMVGLVKMPGRVFTGRRVATADIAAGLALAQRNPLRAFFQAVFTDEGHGRRRKVGRGQVFEMITWAGSYLSSFDSLDGWLPVPGKWVILLIGARHPPGLANLVSRTVEDRRGSLRTRFAALRPAKTVR